MRKKKTKGLMSNHAENLTKQLHNTLSSDIILEHVERYPISAENKIDKWGDYPLHVACRYHQLWK